jgi:hypothetical protein
MGVVLRGFDPCLQRYVALKVLDPQLADDELARKRFCREARAAAIITHENVVAIHQVEEDDRGLPFLVMQLVAGESLQERLDRTGKLPLREILRVGMQTAAGLSSAHQHGLIHRDIKPANILIEHGLERVKLTDFGLARAAEDVKLTQTGFVAGTPLFMAPEQARGEALDHRTDLFSLGSVLYAMSTGKPPFQGSTPFMVLRQVTEEVPPPVQQANPEIPEWLVEVIDRLLAKNPADRFQSAAEVAEVLARQLHQLPHSSPAVTPAATPRRTAGLPAARRGWHPFWGISGVAFWLTLAAGAVLAFTELNGLTHWTHFAAPGPRTAEEAAGPAPRATLNAQTGPIWAAAFAPDGGTLAMALDDGTVKIWDVKSERLRATLNAHTGPVWAVAFTAAGKTLATASDDGTVKLWVWKEGTWHKDRVLEHETAVRPLAFAPDGQRLVTGGRNGRVILWDVADGSKHILGEHKGVVMAVAFSPDGKTVASAGGDKAVKLWDAANGQELMTLSGHQGGVYAVAFSPDNRTLASGGWDRTVRLWDAGTGNALATLQGHTQDVWSVAFAPDGRTLASGSEDRTVKLWDVRAGKELKTLRGHSGTVYAVTFSGDGATLASGGRDGTVKLWDVRP